MKPKWVGLIIMSVGAIWLFNNLGFTNIGLGRLISVYWPLILVIWGVESLVSGVNSANNRGSMLSGIILLAFGAAILGRNLGYFDLDLSLIWKVILPLAVIFFGWNLLKGTLQSSGGSNFAVMSGITLKKEGWRLENGSFVAFMGGIEMDMTTAVIPDNEVHLDLTAFMGGIEIRVPRNLTVEFHGTALLGGIEFLGEDNGGVYASKKYLHQGEGDPGKKLIFKGTAIMGGIEVKH